MMPWSAMIPDRCICEWMIPGNRTGWYLKRRYEECQASFHADQAAS